MSPRLRSVGLFSAGAAIAVGGIAASDVLGTRQSRDVAVPGADAPPGQVVAAFIDALNAHDCETAAELATSEHRSSATSWCSDVDRLRDVRIHDPRREQPEWVGRGAEEHVEAVQVEFDLDWRWFRSDGSMPEGPTTWGYVLVRDSDTDPWRILGQGVG